MASDEADATNVPRYEFRPLDGQGDTGFPSGGTQYDMYKLPERRGRNRPNRHWEIGSRLDTQASFAATNSAASAERTLPPVMRKTCIRELIGSPQARGPFGWLPTMHTDECYQSAENFMTGCDAGKNILVRLEGTVSYSHDDAKKKLTQRATAGLSACDPCRSFGAVQIW